MSILVYNKMPAVQYLATALATPIPANMTGLSRGKKWTTSGSELKGRTIDEYRALEAQRLAGIFDFVWEMYPEYDTGPLTVATFFSDMQYQMAQAQLAANTKPPIDAKVAAFEQVATLFEEGQPRAITLYDELPYDVRILSVSGVVAQGVPGAEMYLCCHKDGLHSPHSEVFDVSLKGNIVERAARAERIVEKGEPLFMYCSRGGVIATVTTLLQPL